MHGVALSHASLKCLVRIRISDIISYSKFESSTKEI